MLVHAVYALYLLHPSNCDVMPHPVKICERRSANWWTGQDLSRGLVFRGSFYQSPTRALTTVRTKAVVRFGFVLFVIYRSIRLWMVAMLRCLLESIVSKRILKSSSVPSMLSVDIGVLLKENSFFLFSSLFKKPLFQSRFVIGVQPLPNLVCGSLPCRWCVRAFRIKI